MRLAPQDLEGIEKLLLNALRAQHFIFWEVK